MQSFFQPLAAVAVIYINDFFLMFMTRIGPTALASAV